MSETANFRRLVRHLRITSEGLRCSACKAPCEPHKDAGWRWNGQEWEHKCPDVHPQCGYFAAEAPPPAP